MNIAWCVMRRDRPQMLSGMNLRITAVATHPRPLAMRLGAAHGVPNSTASSGLKRLVLSCQLTLEL